MKSESYNALASLNRSFDVVLESLKILHEEGVVTQEFVSDNSTILKELWSGINWMILRKLNAREDEDRDHYGKIRGKIEERRRQEATVSTAVDSQPESSAANKQP
jgi:hypothetical protein